MCHFALVLFKDDTDLCFQNSNYITRPQLTNTLEWSITCIQRNDLKFHFRSNCSLVPLNNTARILSSYHWVDALQNSLCVPGISEVLRTVKDITSTSLWSARESLIIGLFTPFLQLCTIWYNAFSFPCSEGMPEKFFLGRLKFYSMPSVRMAGENNSCGRDLTQNFISRKCKWLGSFTGHPSLTEGTRGIVPSVTPSPGRELSPRKRSRKKSQLWWGNQSSD